MEVVEDGYNVTLGVMGVGRIVGHISREKLLGRSFEEIVNIMLDSASDLRLVERARADMKGILGYHVLYGVSAGGFFPPVNVAKPTDKVEPHLGDTRKGLLRMIIAPNYLAFREGQIHRGEDGSR